MSKRVVLTLWYTLVDTLLHNFTHSDDVIDGVCVCVCVCEVL